MINKRVYKFKIQSSQDAIQDQEDGPGQALRHCFVLLVVKLQRVVQVGGLSLLLGPNNFSISDDMTVWKWDLNGEPVSARAPSKIA